MKTIGIKLADGSFYPVLQENTVAEKKLELTTAHNNQTKVMVDLYRSALCTMDDAEYVDSLQIDNLVEHPNGEASIAFSVSLDENNELSAKIVDAETGNQSKTTITLVSRTQEERLITDEYDITDSKEKSMEKKVAAGGGLLAAAAALRAKEEANDTTEVEFTPAGDMNFDVQEEPEVEEKIEETSVEEPVVESTEEPAMEDFSIPEEPAEEPVVEPAESIEINDDFAINLPEDSAIEAPVEEEATPSDDLDLPDFPEDTVVFPEEDQTPAAEETESSELPDINFDFPGDDSDQISASETINDDLDLPDFPEDTTIATDDDPFALPGDDPFETTETESTEAAFEPDVQEDNFDIDIPDTTEEPEMPDNFFDMDDEPKSSSSYEAPASGGISFTGLYDKETELGESSSYAEEEVKKKTKVPVIICIVCAIICLIATAFVLLVIPSKFNLLHKRTDKEVVIEQPAETPAPAPVVEPEPEPEPEPVPEAKEDEIVIIEKAEEVVPEQPPVAEEKPKDITYKIKWGDTLWDIADTYYKNPWRYKYIARFNKIKNPDYIISGTYITIPAE